MGRKPAVVLVCVVMAALLMFVASLADMGRAVDSSDAAVPDGSGEVTLSVPADGGWDAFAGFAEAGPEEMAGLLADGPVKCGLAGRDLYIECADGSGHVCSDAPASLLEYARFSGCEPVALSREDVRPAEAGGDGTPAFFPWAMLAGAVLMALAACRRMRAAAGRASKARREPSAFQSAQRPSPGPVPAPPARGQEAARPRDGVPAVRFDDVEGVQGLKDDLARLVDCLVHPARYEAMGARTPKGVILYGPPGTGKTLLARAIAGEARVPFLTACGSDFIEKYVGVGAKRVRELYEKARKQAPCIVFIDEVDAIASRRGSDENSERDQAVNALLSELDGFDGRSGVITICATNRLDLLDEAFQRAGRFDLKLAVGLPDLAARERILEIHSRNKPLDGGIGLGSLARRCAGFSGADLEALLNEAAMCAAARGAGSIGPGDVDDAFFKIVMKGNKKPHGDRTETLRLVAWHEAGHVLATKLLTDDAVPSVTIMGSSSGAGGVTFRSPDEGAMQSRKYLRALICVMYAGRAAEEICLGDPDLVTVGAQQDIKQATSLIREYLMAYGMGEKGMLDMSQFGRDGASVADEAARMAGELYGRAKDVLSGHRDLLEDLAMALVDKETLDEAEIDGIIGKAA